MSDEPDESAYPEAGGLFGELAGELWAGHEAADQFPRPIEQVAPLRLPVLFIPLPTVTVELIRRWTGERRLAASLPNDSRELMGCLIAHRGNGYVFICSTDLDDERRLTAAHEIAHFLLDYLRPRRQVLAALGDSAKEILDGVRPPTLAERARALLAHVHLGPHVHLFPRGGVSEDDDVRIAAAESRVHALALELVAPRRRIAERLAAAKSAETAAGELASYFGLPAYVFRGAIRAAMPRPLPLVLQLARARLRPQSGGELP